MITVSELVAARHLKLSVRACPDRLGEWIRRVRAVDTVEAAGTLTGGELVLATDRWNHDPPEIDRFVCALARRRASALVVPAPRQSTTPDDVIGACERWRLPLIESPAGTQWQDVAECALILGIDRRRAGLMRTVERHRTLLAAVAPEGEFRPVLDALHDECASTVWLLTAGGVFTASGARRPSIADVSAVVGRRESPESGAEIAITGGDRAWVFPVVPGPAGRRAEAVICVVTDEEPSTELRLAVDQARDFLAAALAVTARRRGERVATATEFLARLSAPDAAPDEIAAWSRALGVELRGHVVCVTAQVPAADRHVIDHLVVALDQFAAAVGSPAVVAAGPDEASAFVFHRSADDAVERALAELAVLLEPDLARTGAVLGTSSAITEDAAGVYGTLLEARQVCRFNRLHDPEADDETTTGGPPLAAMLLADDMRASRSLESAMLAPLLAYDQKHDSELVRTLDVFLSSAGQWATCASALGIHVNTVRYRLGRIEKLTGRSITSMADRVDFYLALRTREKRVADRSDARRPVARAIRAVR
ncbi:helix-turn-helix domain-containing protein [Pseudonocardia sp. C8]|uniref:helix-turn-helix domain-containing protein n=1 Tax=Pseudonocardia sp. C8 TaxID=2762759 RepID=UPI0016425366|nr:helix-turn-helix domain-containing protein [Pseudonocardia sp. C8]